MKKLFTLFLVLFLALSFSCGGSHGGEEENNDDDALNLTAAQKLGLPTVAFAFYTLIPLGDKNSGAKSSGCDIVISEDDKTINIEENCEFNSIYSGSPPLDCEGFFIRGELNYNIDSQLTLSGEVVFSHTSLFTEEITCDIDIEGDEFNISGTICDEDILFNGSDTEDEVAKSEICQAIMPI
jgi:hypothetical protein